MVEHPSPSLTDNSTHAQRKRDTKEEEEGGVQKEEEKICHDYIKKNKKHNNALQT